MVRIAAVRSGTIAEALDLEIGSRVVRINGEPVRDGIDFRFKEADPVLELEVHGSESGQRVVYEIEKEAGEALGLTPEPDTVRECANKCVFCFIDGNPEGVRDTLDLRDDDFRLSFTYGNYVTLTNLGPRGFQRLIDQKLSPLYVSVHATEPHIRERILGVPRGGDILDRLRRLTGAGLEVHAQVVLCPGWNDGEHLARTIEDLWGLGPRLLSLSVVPVGLTRYNLGKPVRLLTPEEASAAIDQVNHARRRAHSERGLGWAYVGDELYYIAGEPLPPRSYYDDGLLTENGVGSVRALLDDLEAATASAPRLDGQRLGIATGSRMAEILEPWAPRISAATGAEIRIVPVTNRLFGESVNTAGLMPGKDLRSAVASHEAFDAVLFTAEAINDDGLFIDDVVFEKLAADLSGTRLVPAHRFTDGLAAL